MQTSTIGVNSKTKDHYSGRVLEKPTNKCLFFNGNFPIVQETITGCTHRAYVLVSKVSSR